MNRIIRTLPCLLLLASCAGRVGTDLTVIPPGKVSSAVNLDIRYSVSNPGKAARKVEVRLMAGDSVVFCSKEKVAGKGFWTGRTDIPASLLAGKDSVVLSVVCGKDEKRLCELVKVIDSEIRSTRGIDGAYLGITHWSDIEGKNWNPAQRKMTDGQWREMIASMHKIGMNIIVIQELFHCDNRCGRHDSTVETYPGKAYYPSNLYPARMEMTAVDPVEAIFSVADSLGMKVVPGIGNFARFDFTDESIEWHKRVAKEVWEKYGHHRSFYGFYVSEESGGSLDLWEKSKEKRQMRKDEIVKFFAEFKAFCATLAPAKPTMFSTNSFGIRMALETYPKMLENLDILCPFGFARQPEKDLTGYEAANLLQKMCDEAGSHLWFDLEAFLFNPDNSLYPRDIEGIIGDLTLLDNFEKVICYQYPGVFSDPASDFLVGEEKTLKLFTDYREYLENLEIQQTNTTN